MEKLKDTGIMIDDLPILKEGENCHIDISCSGCFVHFTLEIGLSHYQIKHLVCPSCGKEIVHARS